jgi:hypothetical protein
MINTALNKAETAAISATHVALIQEQIDHIDRLILEIELSGKQMSINTLLKKRSDWLAILEAVQKPVNDTAAFRAAIRDGKIVAADADPEVIFYWIAGGGKYDEIVDLHTVKVQ